jgi:hypothetical protein
MAAVNASRDPTGAMISKSDSFIGVQNYIIFWK